MSSGGSTYIGVLSGCGGSVSSSLSYGGGSYGSLSSLDNGLSGVVTRVGVLEANSITTNNLYAKIAALSGVSVVTLSIGNQTFNLGGSAVYKGTSESGEKVLKWI